MRRDFTFIDDIVSGMSKSIDEIATPNSTWSGLNPDPATSYAPYRIFNIGSGRAVNLLDYIHALEEALGKKAIKKFLPLQKGDVLATHADITRIQHERDYISRVDIKEGISQFVAWYLNFYKTADGHVNKKEIA